MCYPISLSEERQGQHILLTVQKRSGKPTARWYRQGEREGKKYSVSTSLEETDILVHAFHTMIPAGVERRRKFCLEWRMCKGLVTACVSASDLLLIEKSLLRFLLVWLQGKSLLPDTQFICYLMLLGAYLQYNGWPAQRCDKASSFLLYPSPTEANLRPHTAFLKHASSCQEMLRYFGISLWQTQLKFLCINQTPPHCIHLGAQLLCFCGLLELCHVHWSPIRPGMEIPPLSWTAIPMFDSISMKFFLIC